MDLYLIVGFLGAGKTTFLQEVLKHETDPIGIVVNDFGTVNVDQALFQDKGVVLQEVTNGSIFCSCRSDQFVEAVTLLSRKRLKRIYVEGSGLSSPYNIVELVEVMNSLTDTTIEYRGAITIVDATSLHKVEHVEAVKQQLIHSDLILLNKTDLVYGEGLEKTMDIIRKYNPLVSVIPTKYCKIPFTAIHELLPVSHRKTIPVRQDLTLQKETIDLTGYNLSDVEQLAVCLSNHVDRIKGHLSNPSPMVFEFMDGALKTYPIKSKHTPCMVVLSTQEESLTERVQLCINTINNL